MKRALTVLLTLCAIWMGFAGVAAAQIEKLVWMKVPFPFYAGDKLLPAGQYSFAMPNMNGFTSGTIMRITAKDDSICQHMLSMRIDGVTASADIHVTFHKYGETYFLSHVRNSDLGAQLPKYPIEKVAQAKAAKALTPIASIELKGVLSKAK